jgi:para-aminobenzoate synthetase component 1
VIVNPEALEPFKQQALQWASGFDVAVYLDSGAFADGYSNFETIVAAGIKTQVKYQAGKGFEQLAAFREENQGWVFGYLAYDLKNEVEHLSSNNPDHLNFPDLYFFVPQHLILIGKDGIEIISAGAEKILMLIEQQTIGEDKVLSDIEIRSRFNKAEYIDTVKTIQQHIIRGDIYETNFCQEFYAENVAVDPLSVFRQLHQNFACTILLLF